MPTKSVSKICITSYCCTKARQFATAASGTPCCIATRQPSPV